MRINWERIWREFDQEVTKQYKQEVPQAGGYCVETYERRLLQAVVEKYLGNVETVALRPSDIIVVNTELYLTREEALRLKEILSAEFVGHKVIVLGAGNRLTVLQEEKS